MCRMMAVYTKTKIRPEQLERFKLLARDGKVGTDKEPGHHDGWGLAFYNGLNEPEYAGRAPNSAVADGKLYDAAVAKVAASQTHVAMAHVRKCSVGNKSMENTHPFFEGDWMFAHNGTIENYSTERSRSLAPVKPAGTTDSELFFKFLASDIKKGAEPMEAAGVLLSEVTRRYKHTSATFLLTNGRKLYGVHESATDPDYYTLHAARDGDSVILAQEPLWGLQWREVPNHHYIVVDHKMGVDVRPIPHVGAGA